MQDRITQINEILLHCTAGPYIGSFASIHDGSVYVRFTPDSDRIAEIPELPKSADFVAKVC